MEADGWRLEAGGWRLKAGGWRLEAGGWIPGLLSRKVFPGHLALLDRVLEVLADDAPSFC